MKTYPVNLVLEGKLVVLVGAGREIARKIPSLLEVGAKIKVIAPATHKIVRRFANEEKIEWIDRRYQSGDLSGAFMLNASWVMV